MGHILNGREALLILFVICIICGIYLLLIIRQLGREIMARAGERVQVTYILENWTHDLLTAENLNKLSTSDLDQLIFMLSRAEAESPEAFEEAIKYHIH